MITALLRSGPVPVDPAARIDRLEALERLKSAACAGAGTDHLGGRGRR